MHMIGIPAVAHQQDGVFTTQQAREAGWTPRQIRRRQSTGEWVRVAGRGIAARASFEPSAGAGGVTQTPMPRVVVSHASPSSSAATPCRQAGPVRPRFPARALARAAQLTWPDAVACRRTAAALHGFPVAPGSTAEVATLRRRRAVLRLRPHLQEDLQPEQVTEVDGLRVTDRVRTAIDCLAYLPFDEALDLYVWLWTRRELPRRRIVEAVQGRIGRPGTVQLRRLLAATRYGAVSSFGYRLHRLLKAGGMVGWMPGSPASGLADAAASSEVTFPAARVVVMVRGPRPGVRQESSIGTLRAGSRYDSFARAGFLVLRVTPAELLGAPDTVVARIRHALSARRSPSGRTFTAQVTDASRRSGAVPFTGLAQERVRAPDRPASTATWAARPS